MYLPCKSTIAFLSRGKCGIELGAFSVIVITDASFAALLWNFATCSESWLQCNEFIPTINILSLYPL